MGMAGCGWGLELLTVFDVPDHAECSVGLQDSVDFLQRL